ncbi:hypothetical protein I2I11_14755 [Pontibacter sp. 172403-2]|uniref:hypothetical protein n=1 Tax=Pontibacter rufus TaxID=2791028 RepID=UPI0018AF7A5A|nr:hypothetical protein [Pontibacter sp. 172403-2]MBF9254562.1 hypothetical protein [Pontibacter sp. 172403-2]
MRELDSIREGLANSNTLLLKYQDKGVECAFVREGLVKNNILIQDKVLAEALHSKSINGIIEGDNFQTLRNNYSWFSLSVKSKRLYQELQHA